MKQKAMIVTFASLAAVMILAAGLVSANQAFGKGHHPPMMNDSMINVNPMFEMNKTLMVQIQNAIKTDNYTEWQSLMQSQITQANFDKLVAFSQNMTAFNGKMGNFTHFSGQDGNFTNSSRFNMMGPGSNHKGFWSPQQNPPISQN